MRVRVLSGPKAGEVVDSPVRIARLLLADGRAVPPEVDVTVAPEVVAVTSTLPGVPGVFLRSKRRR
jgi:hypothetical protein